MAFVRGEIRGVRLHLERLKDGARRLSLPCSDRWEPELEYFLSHIRENSVIRLILLPDGCRQISRGPLPDPEPIRLRLSPPLSSPFPRDLKHRARSTWQQAEKSAGAELLFEEEGLWLESSRANIYVERDGCLYTSPTDGRILPGVTRSLLLELARREGIPLQETPLSAGPPQALYISSALRGFQPVLSLEEQTLSEGPLGRKLRECWERYR